MPPGAPADGENTPPERHDSQALHDELDRFKRDLRAAGLRESTVHSYLMGSRLFVRWLAGDYAPGPGRAQRPPAS